MAYHKSNFGAFAESIPADMNGYVPEATDEPWDLSYDHGTERTHNADGSLTEYGEWWEDEGFPAIQEEAIAATERANDAVKVWRDQS